MAALFGAKKKPLFGDPMERYGAPQATPGFGDGIGHTPEMRQAAQPTPQPRTGLGTRLFGQGWEDKAFALGGIMQGDPSGVMMMRRDQQMQQQAAADAAAAQRKRAQELADWQWKQEWERDNPKPVAPNLREDNAGNVWQFDPQSGRPMGDKPVWVDPTEKVIYQDGMQIRVPNPYRGGARGLDSEPTEEDGYIYTPGPGGRGNKENWKAKGDGAGNSVGGF